MVMKIFRLIASLYFAVMGILILLGKYEPSLQAVAFVAFMAAGNAISNGGSNDQTH